MIKVAIVEDDFNSTAVLKQFLSRYSEENNVKFLISEYTNGMLFIENYQPSFDIVFMDIEMPLLDGLEASKMMRKIDSHVCLIFVTNMFQLAVKGYEVNAMDFVVKPIEYFNFSLKIKKAIDYCKSLSPNELYLQFKSGFKKIKVADIYYIESVGHSLIFHLPDGTLEIRCSMKDMEDKLADKNFSRCSNSYLVNLKYVSELSGNNIKIGGDVIAVGRTKRKSFLSDLTDYLGGTM